MARIKREADHSKIKKKFRMVQEEQNYYESYLLFLELTDNHFSQLDFSTSSKFKYVILSISATNLFQFFGNTEIKAKLPNLY